jgi:hypothetical protein
MIPVDEVYVSQPDLLEHDCVSSCETSARMTGWIILSSVSFHFNDSALQENVLGKMSNEYLAE